MAGIVNAKIPRSISSIIMTIQVGHGSAYKDAGYFNVFAQIYHHQEALDYILEFLIFL